MQCSTLHENIFSIYCPRHPTTFLSIWVRVVVFEHKSTVVLDEKYLSMENLYGKCLIQMLKTDVLSSMLRLSLVSSNNCLSNSEVTVRWGSLRQPLEAQWVCWTYRLRHRGIQSPRGMSVWVWPLDENTRLDAGGLQHGGLPGARER